MYHLLRSVKPPGVIPTLRILIVIELSTLRGTRGRDIWSGKSNIGRGPIPLTTKSYVHI